MDHHSRLEDILTAAKRWECSLFFNESADPNKPIIIDLCDKLESGKDYIFPERFKGLSSKKALMNELCRSSIRSGFPMDIRNSKKQSLCKKGVEHEIYVSCLAGIKYNETKKKIIQEQPITPKRKYVRKKEGKNDTLSWRYTNLDEKCDFAFTIQLITSDIAKFPFQQNLGRWRMKVCLYISA